MQPDEVLPLDQIDLSDFDFWLRPWEEREGAFATLRRERPIAFFEEPDVSANTSIPLPQGPGYYALTSHADITHVSRHP